METGPLPQRRIVNSCRRPPGSPGRGRRARARGERRRAEAPFERKKGTKKEAAAAAEEGGGRKKTKRSEERRRERRRRREAKKTRRSPRDGERTREEERGRKGVFLARRVPSPFSGPSLGLRALSGRSSLRAKLGIGGDYTAQPAADRAARLGGGERSLPAAPRAPAPPRAPPRPSRRRGGRSRQRREHPPGRRGPRPAPQPPAGPRRGAPSPSGARGPGPLPPSGSCETGPAARPRVAPAWARGARLGSACWSCWSTPAPPSTAKPRKVRKEGRGLRGGRAAGPGAGARFPRGRAGAGRAAVRVGAVHHPPGLGT